MWKAPLKTKVVTAYTTVFGLLLLGFAALTYVRVRNTELRELDATLEVFASRVAEDVAQDVEDGETSDPAELQEFIPEKLSNVHVQVWDRESKIYLADSLLSTFLIPLPDIADEETFAQSYAHAPSNFRIFWQPVEIDGDYPYVVQVAASLAESDRELADLRWLFLLLIPVSLLLAGAFAYALTNAAFRPIDRIIDTAQAITAQNLNARVELPAADDEVKKLAVTLNELLARIEKAFESQRQFVADASHELRSPLTVLRTELEFVQRHLQDAKTPAGIETAIHQTARLERLTEQLLTLSWVDAAALKLELRPVRLDDLVMDCVQSIRPFAERKHVQINVFVQDAIEFPGDAMRLKSAITNLLDNAIKYSPPQRAIDVELKQDRNSRTATLSVADEGPGIEAAEQELIFRRFYRAKAQRGEANGGGLGLAIARHIVELHHGSLTVSSENGNGARFVITLPLTADGDGQKNEISA